MCGEFFFSNALRIFCAIDITVQCFKNKQKNFSTEANVFIYIYICVAHIWPQLFTNLTLKRVGLLYFLFLTREK